MRMKKNIILLGAFLLVFVFSAKGQGIITTIAGNGTIGSSGDGGLATNANLFGPYSVALDGLGNYYIADSYNNRIRKVDATGIITTIAGNDTGGYNGDNIPAVSALIKHPAGIACDASGNVYFGDSQNNRVRKINTSTGIITTIAGNGVMGYNGDGIAADTAELNNPYGVTVDDAGNIYITDCQNHRIRKINPAGIISTIAGTGIVGNNGDNGPADSAEINIPYGIVTDNSGNVYFSDYYSGVIRKVATSGIITTIAGLGTTSLLGDNGPADSARFNDPGGIAIDGSGNIYVADGLNQRIRKITMATGIITTVAGDGTEGYNEDNVLATNAKLADPTGIAVDATGNIYIADFGNSRIRFVTSTESVGNVNNTNVHLGIYPNPSMGSVTIDITAKMSAEVNITITNTFGKKVSEFITLTNQPVTIQMDEPDGVYFISAIADHQIYTETMILRK